MKCKVSGCTRPLKASGYCHVHLKEFSKPYQLKIGGSDFTSWQKRQNLERSWKKEAVNQSRNSRARRKRTEAIDMATPVWLTPQQKAEIASMYEEARKLSSSGTKYEVDHIVPLHGAVVCGLHVPWNMRVVSKDENNRRGNREFNEARNAEDIE